MDKGTGGIAAIRAEVQACAAEEAERANRRAVPARKNNLAPERW